MIACSFEIVTAANMSGIKEAQAGFLGMNSGLTALIAGLGLAVVAGKSAIENTEAMEKAHKSLAQAVNVSKYGFWDLQRTFDDWAETNKRFISNQYEAETALAAFVRAGANEKDAMRELNDALDLSVLRGIPMEDAQKNITLALTGSTRALKVLGITTAEYDAIIHDKHLSLEQQHLAILALIESKTKDGRKAQTDLSQSTQTLNKDWQDISTKVGPPLLGLLAGIASGADWLITKLKELGDNTAWNVYLSGAFGNVQNAVVDVVHAVEALIGGIKWLGDNAHKVLGTYGGGVSGPGTYKGRGAIAGATGYSGMVSSPTLFLAGEGGQPEHVQITPGGRSAGQAQIHIHIDRGAYIDGPSVDRLANMIALRLGYATGR